MTQTKFGKTVKVDSWMLYCKIVENHKSVHDFCKKNNISYATVSNLVNGSSQATKATTLIKIAGALECPVSILIVKKEIAQHVQQFIDHVRA